MNVINHPILLTDDSGFEVEAAVRIKFDYSPFERATRDCPGSPETVDVRSATVFVGNFELGAHPAPLAAWESTVWQHIHEQRRADELDRAMARAA
jgi:hypothetical protein